MNGDQGRKLTRATALSSTRLQVVNAHIDGLIRDLREQLDQICDTREKGEAIYPEYALEFAQRATRLAARAEAAAHLRDIMERSTR